MIKRKPKREKEMKMKMKKLSIKQLGLPVDKSMQCSDWSERPLVEVRKDLLMFVCVSVLFVYLFKYLFINDLF